MNDRRRINGPGGGTAPPILAKNGSNASENESQRPRRTRRPNSLRKMFLKTGVTPSASGSAYLELESQLSSSAFSPSNSSKFSSQSLSGLKLICTVHGPRPLPRSAPFIPHILLTTHVKYAPFATRQRRGYLRDSSERDLAVHLETALRGVIIGDRWPKSGVEVVITILEGEEDLWWGDEHAAGLKPKANGQWGMMSVLSGCITVAAAAIADAGIDCVDLVSGGVAAVVRDRNIPSSLPTVVLDPIPSEHHEILAACVVGYLFSRDEITDMWMSGNLDATDPSKESTSAYEILADHAVQAAKGSHRVLSAALEEAVGI